MPSGFIPPIDLVLRVVLRSGNNTCLHRNILRLSFSLACSLPCIQKLH